jgi:hypothetical protein
MAESHITLKVDVLYPNRVTLKMLCGAFLAWLLRNHYFLLKCGWKVTVKDSELNEF